ncbi:UDP-N-acetylmuramoyl-tripeptide--D-alanyl-D-alanine ligase [Listeria costaricensis]|uniref:UDP-N-acetylmuramoyl-tripeptide--D-alanyl-D- alanine ligase n=1 Tax=Listeria costaricensis TaxID=2026604 RepID=UPI000C06EA52|nr:UDP-N-acetylmuramoyl-tripeptide--D-alanyl-D-alanine ligase [Listeria costaricensis]
MKKTMGQIARMLGIEQDLGEFEEKIVTGICFDTRQLQPGDLFVPFVGAERDGHTFVKQAIDQGAACAFWQRDIPNPLVDYPVLLVEDTLDALQQLARMYREEVNPFVVGITGSNGKTTTKDITRAIFESTYRTHATAGNFNNHIGLPYTILTMAEDTEVAILEMGMNHRHEIERLSTIARPDVAIITNIGEAHIEHLGSRAGIAEAKLEIQAGLKEDGFLIIPNEEPLLRDQQEISPYQTFGRETSADIYPTEIRTETDGTWFQTNLTGDTELFVPIIGEHNVFNTMAAILAAQECRISVPSIQQALLGMERSKSRLEWLETKKGARILNDAYNSSPTALQAVLRTFMSMDSGAHAKWAVLADMLELGENSERFHRESAAGLEKGKIDQVFLYGQAMKAFQAEAASRIGQENVHYFDTKDALMDALLGAVTGNEWILVKGSYGMGLKDVVEKLIIGA